MITLVIIDRLRWKAYLIFMCTNLAVVPPVYFCYPVTANPALEEIDYVLVHQPRQGRCQTVEGIAQGRNRDTRQQSFVQTSAGYSASSTRGSTVHSSMDKLDDVAGAVEQYEKVQGTAASNAISAHRIPED